MRVAFIARGSGSKQAMHDPSQDSNDQVVPLFPEANPTPMKGDRRGNLGVGEEAGSLGSHGSCRVCLQGLPGSTAYTTTTSTTSTTSTMRTSLCQVPLSSTSTRPHPILPCLHPTTPPHCNAALEDVRRQSIDVHESSSFAYSWRIKISFLSPTPLLCNVQVR